MARVAHAAFVTIGLAFLIEIGLTYTIGFDGPVLNTIGSIAYVVVMLGLPFMAVFTVAWLVVEFVRRFRRCRATRLA